ncbi:MAG: hypothetical protein QW112_01275 [Candidatus Micrarchaeia archaeon]
MRSIELYMNTINTAKIITIFLLLVSVALAMWSETVDIYTVDLSGRYIPGANVTIIYQAYQCGRHELINLVTNSSGGVRVTLNNNVAEEGVYPPCVEKYYTIRASYIGVTAEKRGNVGTLPSYHITLPVAEYKMYVKGADGNEIYPINVSVDGIFISSSTSIVTVRLPVNRTFDIKIYYGSINGTARITLSGDKVENFTLPVYDLHIQLYNDTGDRIKGQIKVDGLSQWSLLTEDAVFEKFPFPSANFTVIVDNTERHIYSIIDKAHLALYVDMTPPAIKDVTQTAVGGNVRISAVVSDEGVHASGLAKNPIIQYLFNDSLDWSIVKMYQKSARIFEGEIPANGQNIVYQIIAEDMQGNKEVYDGRYDFKATQKPTKPSGIDIWKLVSQPSLPHIIGVIIFIFIIIVVYVKIKEVL